MSEAFHYPDFYESIEGRPPLDSEKLTLTTKAFNDLFDDLMLQNMDQVSHFELFEDEPTAKLLKYIEVNGQTYALSVEDLGRPTPGNYSGIEFRDSEITTRQIALQRIYEDYGRECWKYQLGADDIVRRWDNGDVAAKTRPRNEGATRPNINKTSEEIGRTALNRYDEIKNISLPNTRLEEDMGLNNQPVTPEEIDGLKEFLLRSTDL